MNGEALAVIGTASGAIIVIVGNLITTFLNNRARMREKRKELIMSTALEYWRRNDEKATEVFLSGKYSGPINSQPLENYIISIAKASEVLGSETISEDEVLRVLRELGSLNIETLRESIRHTESVSETRQHNKPEQPSPTRDESDDSI